MIISEITLLEVLRDKFRLSEQDARELAKELVQAEQRLHGNIDKKFDSKESSLRADIASLREELREHFATKEDVTRSKLDMIKWIVGFWIVQMAAIIGLYVKH